MNKYIQQSESVEQIIAAAIRLKGGRIYQSHSHSRCIADAIANGEKGPVDCEQGFVTSTGRFVSRTEAMTIAYKAKQTYRSEGELFSEDVTYPQMKSPPHKELCPNCGGDIAIRNPTGHCDHLYYPENVPHKKHKNWENEFDRYFLDINAFVATDHSPFPCSSKVFDGKIAVKCFISQLLLSTQQEAVEKERVRAKAAWRAAESHGKLIYPNPYGNSLTVKRHNQVIYEMREKFYSAFTPKETV